MSKTEPYIEELAWDKAEKLIGNCTNELINIIKEIDPKKELTFIKVRYPFGSIMIHDDVLHLPFEDETNSVSTIPITDPRTATVWKEKLGYRSIPMGMIIKNSVEIYREINDRVFSVALSGPSTGIEIGIVEVFGTTAAYTVSSGARSLYMVPRITKLAAYKKLRREFGITAHPPKHAIDHWRIFKELYNSEQFGEKWECEVLFLSNKWNNNINKDEKKWIKFKSYIQQKAWEHSELGRRKVMMDVVWQIVSGVLTTQGIKPDPYVVDTLRHIIFISLGGISGSRPVNGDDFAGPLNRIQSIYTDIYGIDQIPTIMRPHSFSLSENKPVYYSMQIPMMLSSTPNFRNMSSMIEDMRELINVKNHVFGQNYGNLKIDNTRFNDLLDQIKLEYYHGEMYAYGKEIRPTHEMPATDPEFLYMPTSPGDRKFADNGAFVRGCIKISKKEEK